MPAISLYNFYNTSDDKIIIKKKKKNPDSNLN